MEAFALLFFATVLATSHGYSDMEIRNQIHYLRLLSGSGGARIPGLSCLSWRVGVEANNIIGWKTIPQACEKYVGHYMLGEQYRKDSKAVTDEAFLFAQSLKLVGDGKDVWVFDIDETTLSNLPYYAEHGFGAEPFNLTLFDEWVNKGEALALPESLKLYKKLLSLGFKVVFLTGRLEDKRYVTTTNLKKAGYHTWEKLLLE